jgi:hypothetical protein
MNAAQTVLDDLAVAGATITIDGDRLVIRAGARPVTKALVAAIRREKPSLLKLVRAAPAREPFLHYCEICGEWGAFGYSVNLRAGRLGQWYCFEHRPNHRQASDIKDVEARAA